MRLILLLLFLGFIFISPYYPKEPAKSQVPEPIQQHKVFDFYKLKREIKNIVEDSSKQFHYTKFHSQIDAILLKTIVSDKLGELKKQIPFNYDVIYMKPNHEGQIVPDLVLTVATSYKDPFGEVVWGFNIVFYDYKIEFYVSNKIPILPGEAYNYLTLYRA